MIEMDRPTFLFMDAPKRLFALILQYHVSLPVKNTQQFRPISFA